MIIPRSQVYVANPRPTNYVVTVGDSIVFGKGAGAGRGWVDQLSGTKLVHNLGISGQLMNEIRAGAATKDALMLPKYQNNILIVSAGINDINTGRTGVQAYADLVAYCALMKPLVQVLLVCTITKFASFNATQQGYREEYNDLILAGTDNLQRTAIINMGAISGLQDPEGVNMDADGKHPNQAGHQLMADLANLTLSSYLLVIAIFLILIDPAT